jgi:hypothetical protein
MGQESWSFKLIYSDVPQITSIKQVQGTLHYTLILRNIDPY